MWGFGPILRRYSLPGSDSTSTVQPGKTLIGQGRSTGSHCKASLALSYTGQFINFKFGFNSHELWSYFDPFFFLLFFRIDAHSFKFS